MAISLLGSWTTQTGPSPSHAIESGSDRLFVIGIGMSSVSFPNEVTAVSMGGQSLTRLIGRELVTSITTSSSIWYAGEATIAAMTDGNVSISNTTGTAILTSSHAFFGGVDQTTPWGDSDSASASNAASLSLPAIDTVSGGLLVTEVTRSSGGSVSWTSGVSDSATGSNATTPSNAIAVGTAAGTGSAITAAAGLSSSASRVTAVGGCMRPAAGGGGSAFANPLALLGVGRTV